MRYALLALLVFLVSVNPVKAATEYRLTLQDHKFKPATLEIPAGEKVKLFIDNKDSSAEEFESHDFNREKIIPGNSTGFVFVGPLSAGTYKFYGEFHPETARGTLTVK